MLMSKYFIAYYSRNTKFKSWKCVAPNGRAPTTFHHAVTPFLNEMFPECWIRWFGSVALTAFSHGLSSINFFLWGYLKHKIYNNIQKENIQELKNRILLLSLLFRTSVRSLRTIILRHCHLANSFAWLLLWIASRWWSALSLFFS